MNVADEIVAELSRQFRWMASAEIAASIGVDWLAVRDELADLRLQGRVDQLRPFADHNTALWGIRGFARPANAPDDTFHWRINR